MLKNTLSKLFLRIASLVIFLHDVGHTIGHLTWKQSPVDGKQAVIKAMTDNYFPFMGASHSMGDYYDGYGYASTVILLFIAFLLWFLSSATSKQNPLSRNILSSLIGFLFVWFIIELIYFFPFAAAFSLTAMLLCIASWVMSFGSKS